MSKEYIEALDWLEEKCYVESPQAEKFEECCKIIRQFLHRLESIDNANPSEALECLEKLKGMEISSMPFSDEYGTQEVDLNDIRKVGSQLNTDFREYTATIEQALLKAQKEHKALEIIKKHFNIKLDVETELNGNVWGRLVSIQAKEDKDTWDTTASANIVDYKEEFNLLKEVLE